MSDRTVLASSAVMAAGTTFSRLSGVLRTVLLAAALGIALRADMFTIANTLPNMIYILVAGGIFNAVLVPQLVRAMKHDPDGGDAYAQRVITLAAIFLALVTVVLIIATPWLLGLYLDDDYAAADRAAHLESITNLTRLCLPQVFFYGMFVLVGQILNSRERFGPMMWAPIANNVVAVAMLATYLLVYGRADQDEQELPLGTGQELLLGIGSTLGIALQLLILLPYLRAVGFRFKPRFDFRDEGLARTFSLGLWTLLFVVVNQVAYLVVVKLASGGTIRDPDGTGPFVYSSAFLIVMVPHSIITVSLATAILPRISAFAADHQHPELGRTIGSTLRTSLAIVLPFVALLPVISTDVANALFGWREGSDTGARFAPTLSLFAVALLFFTVHYLMLRGFYALEQTRRVFFIQCAIAATNIVGAIVLVGLVDDDDHTAPALALAYLVAYAVGSAISYAVLRRVLGGIQTPALVRFLLRMLIVVALAALATWLVRLGVTAVVGDAAQDPHPLLSMVRGGLAGSVGMLVVLVLSRSLRIREVNELTDAAFARLRR